MQTKKWLVILSLTLCGLIISPREVRAQDPAQLFGKMLKTFKDIQDQERRRKMRERLEARRGDPRADGRFHYVANLVPGDFLALRTRPSTRTGRRLTKMPNGTALKVIHRDRRNWWYVEVVHTGQRGWAYAGSGRDRYIECCLAPQSPPLVPRAKIPSEPKLPNDAPKTGQELHYVACPSSGFSGRLSI